MRKNEQQHLLLVESSLGYANAVVFLHKIVTAAHVAAGALRITTPSGSEHGFFTFMRHALYDLAVSHQSIPRQGYEIIGTARVGERILVSGHHGPQRAYFAIEAVVLSVASDGRITAQRKKGKKFQLGMSGSAAQNNAGQLLGILVDGVEGKHGEVAIFEPASAVI